MRAAPAWRTMPTTASPPSCCAGLRRTLIHGWQQDFPLHSSPFRLMAARSGATPRELLGLCREMQRSGALQPIHVRWGVALRRSRWRVGFSTADAGLCLALSALPGCDRIERGDPGAPATAGVPTLWAEIEAVDGVALAAQLARLPQAPTLQWRLPAPSGGLDCDDPLLAACVERGLPVGAKPFAACARVLGCSEHRVLSRLSGWRRSGLLDGLVLQPPPSCVPQPGRLLLWRRIQLAGDGLARLRAQCGVDRVIPASGEGGWPWQLGIVLCSTVRQGMLAWEEWLAGLGLGMAPDVSQPLRIEQPRSQALLFDVGAPSGRAD